MKRGNPNHYPKGHPRAGQFAPKWFGAGHRTFSEIDEKYSESDFPMEMYDVEMGKKAMQIQEDIGGHFESAVYIAGALESYTGHEYKLIREYQRGGYADTSTENNAKAIEYFIARAPQWKGKAYRAISPRSVRRYDFSVGNVIDMGGMSSWSSNEDAIPRFTDENGAVFVTENVGTATSIKPYSRWESEDEVLASSQNLYRIERVETRTVLFDPEKGIPFDASAGEHELTFVYVSAINQGYSPTRD